MKKLVAVNTISQLIGRLLGAAATFVVTLFAARQLGAAGYGDFVKITTYVAVFFLLADFGVNAIYLQRGDRVASWSSLVLLRTIGGALLVGIAALILQFLPGTAFAGYSPIVKTGILLYSPAILFQAWITTGNAVLQKRLRYDLSVWAIFFGSLATVGLVWLFFRYPGASALSAATATLVGTAVTAIISFVVASRLEAPLTLRVTVDDLKKLLVPAIPLGITLLFNLVYFRADSFIITLTRPTAEVGVYGLAYKVFELVLVFPTFFMNAVYPLMVTGTHFRKILRSSGIFLFFMSLGSLAVIWLAAPLLTIVKNDFFLSISALRVLILGLPFFFISSLTMWALIARKKQHALAVIYGSSMVVNVVGNLVFVPIYGFMASAWLTVFGEGLVLVLSGVVLSRELKRL